MSRSSTPAIRGLSRESFLLLLCAQIEDGDWLRLPGDVAFACWWLRGSGPYDCARLDYLHLRATPNKWGALYLEEFSLLCGRGGFLSIANNVLLTGRRDRQDFLVMRGHAFMYVEYFCQESQASWTPKCLRLLLANRKIIRFSLIPTGSHFTGKLPRGENVSPCPYIWTFEKSSKNGNSKLWDSFGEYYHF